MTDVEFDDPTAPTEEAPEDEPVPTDGTPEDGVPAALFSDEIDPTAEAPAGVEP